MNADTLETGANIVTILQFLIPTVIGLVSGAVGGIVYLNFFRKKERRLISNWKRPFAIIPSPENSMENERLLLEKASFFDNVQMFAPEGRSVSNITEKHRLVILRFEKGSKYFWDVYEQVANKNIPVIVYAEQGAIERDEFARIQKYIYHTVCNTPVRLLSDVASIMGAYPSAKEFK